MKLRPAASLLPLLLCVISAAGAQPRGEGGDSPEKLGDAAVAEQYCQWAERMIGEGRWSEALAGLERAADFSAFSSDLSLLLARARSRAGGSRGAVLEALERALEANRWVHYNPAQARLLEAEQLIALRGYSAALASLAGLPDSADAAILRLAAIKGLAATTDQAVDLFGTALVITMNRYPRDSRPLRIFFEYAHGRRPQGADQNLLELVLHRLPFVLESDPELAWMAAPFIRDTAEARRLVAAYRAENSRPNPASIPAALNLGLASGREAAEELFSGGIAPNGGPVMDRDLVLELSGLLRDEGERNLFMEKLLSFSGAITADEDRDGHAESRTVYREGTIREYYYDADQDGLWELSVLFDSGGVPSSAEQIVLPDIEAGRAGLPALPLRDDDRSKARIYWESYPAVGQAEMGGLVCVPRPGEFQFAPLRFIELGGSGNYAGLLHPVREQLYQRISLRTLVSFAFSIQRPSAEFEGAMERIELDRGIPLRAEEILNGRTVSITEFERGLPVIQRLDLDLDSRMETVRRFRGPPPVWEDLLEYRRLAASSESDWNGDGIFETGEMYPEDGSVVYSWDMDGDGIREYSETKTGIEK